MSTALVTGATGLLGSHVVERLQDDGWTVRALVRSPEKARRLEDAGVQLVEGDMTDAASVRRAIRGVEAVVHAAAYIAPGGRPEDFRRGNVDATRHVLSAAGAVGARVAFVSSTAVFGQARYRLAPVDEAAPLPDLPAHDLYGRSKQAAEALVLERHRRGGVWATIVRPPVMYGRRDRHFIPRIAPVLRARVFPLLGSGRTTLPIVQAASVADGIVRALEREDAGGRVYHLTTDAPLTVAELVRYAAEGLDIRITAPRLPRSVGRVGFAALRFALTCAGRTDLARHTTGTYRMLTRDNPFRSERARRELGWEPTVPHSTAMPHAFRWWRVRKTPGRLCGEHPGRS